MIYLNVNKVSTIDYVHIFNIYLKYHQIKYNLL
jgi:hypothetical protein